MKIRELLIGTVITLSFSACTNRDNTNDDNTTVKTSIPIIVACITNATATDIDNYQDILAGDEIIKDEPDTIVNIVVGSNGDQKICLQSGAAHILR